MVTNPAQGATVEDVVLDVVKEGGLSQWQQQLIFVRNIRRLDHFPMISEREFRQLGLPPEDIKRLRRATDEVRRRMYQNQTQPRMVYVANTNVATSPTVDPSSTFITKEQIKLMEMLGEGTFAVVKRALWQRDDGKKIDVAVKILRDMSPLVMEDLKVEAGHLLKLQHPNLIRLYGVVQQPAMMVFELCEGGALLDRLRDDKKPIPLLTTLLDYCQQIVKAMSYLETKHCVHRDLAARNILLSRDEKVVKICDFGLMRNLKENEEMYIMGPQKRVPFSWCPPESLKHRKFSHASDVWAFGVTVWEVFSLGEEPWIGCRAIEVLKRLDAGERLEKPHYCSQQIYDIVASCWKVNPEHRPKFSQLKGFLQQAQFNTAEVREAQMESEKNLGLSVGDKVLVVQNIGVTWYGQNERTRKFGCFLRSSVFVAGSVNAKTVQPVAPATPKTPVQTGGNSRISLPIKGSFIHTGHADVRGGNSWGKAEAIDDIYLKNPIIGIPLNAGIPLVVPSHVEQPKSSHLTASRVAPPPPKHHENGISGKPTTLNVNPTFDPLKPDWGDFDAAQAPSFSPSRIELPKIPVGTGLVSGSNMTSSFTSSGYQSRETSISSTREEKRVAEVKPVIPTHNWNPPSSQSSHSHSHSHNVIFPTGVSVGTLPIHPSTSRPSSSNAASQHNISRPPLNIQPIPRPVTENKSKDMPIIRPIDYKHSFNGGQRPVVNPTPVPESSYKPYKEPVTDKNRNLISELSTRIQPTVGPPASRPLNTAQMTPVAMPHLTSSSSDPFVVSAAVKDVVESTRYNEILEKREAKTSLLAPTNTTIMPRPHSTVGIPMSSTQPHPQPIPCLIPTQMPAVPKSNTTVASTVQRQPQSVSSVAVSSVLTKPLTVVIPPERKETSAASFSSNASQQVRLRPQESASTAPPRQPTATTPQPAVTATSQSTAAKPSTTMAPSATSSRQTTTNSAGVTPAGTLPRTTAATEEDRRSRIEEEIAKALPPPSRLFYGNQRPTEEKKSPTSAQPPRPHSVSSMPIASSSSSVDPLPISLNSVLQPIRLHEPPAPVPTPPPEKSIDVSSIMNAYHVPVFANPLNPGFPNAQVPLFALGGPPVRPPQPTIPIAPIISTGVDSTRSATFVVGDNEDIIAALDPLSTRVDNSSQNNTSGVSRASQMEVLYDEASFVDRSRCDEMVKRCEGDIEAALKELKMDQLVNMGIARDKGRAFSALETNNWDLNRAANALCG